MQQGLDRRSHGFVSPLAGQVPFTAPSERIASRVPKSSSKPEPILLKHLLKPLVHVFSAVACSVAAFAGVVDLQPIEAFNAMQALAHVITTSESITDLL